MKNETEKDTYLRKPLYEKIFYSMVQRIPYRIVFRLFALGSYFHRDIKTYYIFLKDKISKYFVISYFISYNKVKGDYFEFGCHSGMSTAIFFNLFKKVNLSQIRLFAFDSFEGFPDLTDIDRFHNYEKGQLSFSYDNFLKVLKANKMKSVISIKGYFDDVLNDELKVKHQIDKASIILIDCDLYSSTVPVLEFIKDMLQTGTVVIFDDYYIYQGDQNKGEQKALMEFQKKYPNIIFREYLNIGFSAKAFIINLKESRS